MPSVFTIRALPHWVPAWLRSRWVVLVHHGHRRVLSHAALFALLDTRPVGTIHLVGDPATLLSPYLWRATRLIHGATLLPLVTQRVTLSPDWVDDRHVRWTSPPRSPRVPDQITLTLAFSAPPDPGFVDIITLALQSAINGSWSTPEELQRLQTLVAAQSDPTPSAIE